MLPIKYIALLAFGTGLTACAPVKFLPTNIEYRCSAPFNDPASSNELIAGLSGERDYKYHGSQFTHEFVIDSPDDYIKVCIHDTAGLSPGRSYLLILKHVDKSQQPINSQQHWNLTVANTGQGIVKEQCFIGSVSGGQFDLINPTPIKGNWMISRTDRAITADLYIYAINDFLADEALEPPCRTY
ncbi:hypothetical protein ACN1C3_14275 [Pseudomonas sp. H11T01]|uniref:hypothetical protein n=1 Tax=Pseudomonas sp. H11T01 TaxID=3402749 RepID=UPI003ACC56B4